jgi:hypothetical protein
MLINYQGYLLTFQTLELASREGIYYISLIVKDGNLI